MLRLDARPLAVHLLPGIGGVELNVLDAAGRQDHDVALAGCLQPLEDLVLHLHVPGEVVLAGLQHGARGRHRVAAAFHLDGVEVRPVLHVVVRVDLALHHVARLEIDEQIGAGADRRQVRRRLAGLGALVRFEQVLGDHHASGADEGVGPERRRLREFHADRVVVDLDDLHVLVAADGHRGGRRIGGVFPVEDAVIGGERMAVVPLHALLELPGDRRAFLGQAAVLDGWDLRGEHRHQVAIGIPPGQRLVEHARAVLVLGADREVRVEQVGPCHHSTLSAPPPPRLVGL